MLSQIPRFAASRLIRNHGIPGPASDRCPAGSNSPVCSRVLPVCQHRFVRYPLGISASAINQTMPVAAVKVSYVLSIRTHLNGMNQIAEFSLGQAEDDSHVGSRSLMIVSFSNGFGNDDGKRHQPVRSTIVTIPLAVTNEKHSVRKPFLYSFSFTSFAAYRTAQFEAVCRGNRLQTPYVRTPLHSPYLDTQRYNWDTAPAHRPP